MLTSRSDGRRVAVEMGRASFDAAAIPVRGERGEVLNRRLTTGDGREVEYSAVTVGNPHCVVVVDEAREADARTLGPLLERHPAFPNRTNVQLVEAVGPHRIRIEIWERGAGYTLASGTSSCAAAAVGCRLGRVRSPVTVEMPGGEIEGRGPGGLVDPSHGGGGDGGRPRGSSAPRVEPPPSLA